MTTRTRFSQWRPHPWHGLETGPNPPGHVNAYIEITPFDLVKYELDKATGYLRVDRPQRGSAQPPALYGIIPRTYCGERVGALMPEAGAGDADPLDICVFSERPVSRSEVIIPARVLGGLPMIDHGEADDKIIAVLENDPVWTHAADIDDVPEPLIERLVHYFMTYKLVPGREPKVSIGTPYDRAHAEAVIQAAIEDYVKAFQS
jgi:inorganic pyrophosphatase